jgi:trehalose/maltose hydrolase-like predicted phosphorylase
MYSLIWQIKTKNNLKVIDEKWISNKKETLGACRINILSHGWSAKSNCR